MSDWTKLHDALIEGVVGVAESVGFLEMALALNAPKSEYREIYEKHLATLRERRETMKKLIHEWELEREK